jgi:DEAD/DEAH box helicase domain-containing protein
MVEALDVESKPNYFRWRLPASAPSANRKASYRGHQPRYAPTPNILPHHTLGLSYSKNCAISLFDGVHQYRRRLRVHLANVDAPSQRLCDFYGSHPQLYLLLRHDRKPPNCRKKSPGRPMKVIDKMRAARESFIVLYNRRW